MPETIVEFEKVVFRYERAEVLHEVSFGLRKGEIVGLLGPNGAGKTTAIKIIAGILAAASGTVAVAGLPLPERAVDVKQRIGYVPEAAILFECLTGQECLELSGRLHDVAEDTLQARIRSILETFNLTSDRVARLDTYSKGMRQKILIAAALLHNPDLILLDEPYLLDIWHTGYFGHRDHGRCADGRTSCGTRRTPAPGVEDPGCAVSGDSGKRIELLAI